TLRQQPADRRAAPRTGRRGRNARTPPEKERSAMRVGLVGFAGSGKSTLFELLTGAKPDPGKVHAGQVGIATLADPRLDLLAELQKPKKVTPATVELLDTPGLIPGTHGDNPQRLALIREGD